MLGELELKDLAEEKSAVPELGPMTATPPSEPPSPAPARLASLDALRGFDMIWITGVHKIFAALAVLTGWPFLKYFVDVQLTHGKWDSATYGQWAAGFHFYDMIMPLFMFCAGASLPFSFAKRAELGQSGRKIFGHVLIRVVLLWVLGSIHQGNLLDFRWSAEPSRQMLHLYCNTLQAIAAGYLIASILVLICNSFFQVILTAGLIAGYWALLQYVPAPGGTPGVLTPESNIGIYVDKLVLGRFQDMTYYTWIVSSIAFGATVMLGVLAGSWLRSGVGQELKGFGLVMFGAVLIAGGYIWSGTSPIVKYIWSSSFVLFSGGICLMLLGTFYLVIDVWGARRWAFPFVVIGANAIVAYMADQFFKFGDIANRILATPKRLMLDDWYAVLQTTVAFGVMWFLLYLMYKKKLFVRV